MKKSNLLILACCAITATMVGCRRANTVTGKRVFSAYARSDELTKTNAPGTTVRLEYQNELGVLGFEGINAYQEGGDYYREDFSYTTSAIYKIQKLSGQGYADLTNKMQQVGFDLGKALQKAN